MKMQLKFKTSDLIDALSSVAIVTPKPFDKEGNTGYLFVVRDEKCYVYSQDAEHVTRATIPILESDGTGSFIYPSAYTDAFKFVGDEVTFDVSNESGSYLIKYTTQSGASAKRAGLDPNLMKVCDDALLEATDGSEVSAGILREALSVTKPFLPKSSNSGSRVAEHFDTVQMFDGSKPEWEKSNGILYASNSIQAVFYHSTAFVDKYLVIHGKNIGALQSFLGKTSGMVRLRKGKNMTFVVDSQDRVFGWTHVEKTYNKIAYYALKLDQIILAVSAENVVKALRYVRTELGSKHDKVRIVFDDKGQTLQFKIIEGSNEAISFPVPVTVEQNTDNRSFEFNCNLNQILELFSNANGNVLKFRIAIMAPDERRAKEGAYFRTLDEFWLNDAGVLVAGSGVKTPPERAYKCLVTRFMPSMN
jgi:hypothetical protein